MPHSKASSGREPLVISQDAMSDLERVLESIEALEIRLCVLSVQMQYDQSAHAPRAAVLSREAGEISERLENVLTFGI